MPKLPENPAQWMPDPNIAVEKLTILQVWSKCNEEIADYRSFQNKKETISSYTGVLKIIEEALKEKTISQLDPFTIMDMVTSVPGRMTTTGDYVEYSINTLTKRLTIIRDVLLYVEAVYSCFNPLSYKMYAYIKEGLEANQISDEVKEHLRTERKNKKFW